MEKQINAAAIALPKLEPVLAAYARQHLPAKLDCIDEEVFYDSKTGEIYVALTFLATLDNVGDHKMLVVRFPPQEMSRPAISSLESVLELDLEDITHLLPQTIRQVLKNQYLALQLKTALQTSVILIDVCEMHDHRLENFKRRHPKQA